MAITMIKSIFESCSCEILRLFSFTAKLIQILKQVGSLLGLISRSALQKQNKQSFDTAGLMLFPASIYLFKVNNKNPRKRCDICSKITAKMLERRQWCHSGVFTVNFENISHLFLVFLLLTLNKYMLAGLVCWPSELMLMLLVC